MENDNTQAHIDTVEQEENVSQEQENNESSDEMVSIPKKDYTKLNRKAMAYDATKKSAITKTNHAEPSDEIVTTVKRLETIENKRQFGYENGLSPEETDAVFKFANGKPTKETLENPFVKAGIESLRAQKRVEDNTPSSFARSTSFGGKQFSEMSEDERRKAFEDKMKGFN